MPLWKSKSKRALKHNIRTEVHAGRPVKQAVAIAYSTQRRAQRNRVASKHLDADARDFRYIKKEARDISRAVTRLERRDKKMRNRSGNLRDYGVAPTRYDRERESYVPTYSPEHHRGGPNKISIYKVKIDRFGYDRRGSYYGTGAPVFSVSDDNGDLGFEMRASDKRAVKDAVLQMFPNARFHR